MHMKGITTLEVAAALMGIAAWSVGGGMVAQAAQGGGGIPPFLIDFLWPFTGAFIVQGFWHLSKQTAWRVAVGTSGAAGGLAGATATVAQFIVSKLGYPFGADIIFMLSIIISILIALRGFDGMFSLAEDLIGWIRGRGKKGE